MPNFVATHIIGLIIALLAAMFVYAVLGQMNMELLEVLKATAIAQQNNR